MTSVRSTVVSVLLDVYKRQEQAYEIMQEAMHQKKGAPGELNLKELPKPKEIKEFLDQYIICLLYTSRCV